MVCSNNVYILHHFQNITTFKVYVTAVDIQVVQFQYKTVQIQATCTSQFLSKHIIADTWYISGAMGVQKVSNTKSDLQGHRRWCHLTGHIFFHCSYVSILFHFLDTVSYFSTSKRSCNLNVNVNVNSRFI